VVFISLLDRDKDMWQLFWWLIMDAAH